MIRSLFSYGRSFALGLADTRVRALMRAHRARPARSATDMEAAMQHAVGYLLRAQVQGTDRGMGSYHLIHGWGASYPETTGYAIPTLLATAQRLQRPDLALAAGHAADWLVGIQQPDGGWQGGRVGEGRPSIVFNTAQVIRGMLAIHAHTADPRYLDSAARAGAWITRVQDPDGAWRASNFLGTARVYDTYVDAPLLRLSRITGDRSIHDAALRNLDWVLSQRAANGWFANADNTLRHNERPITHTIAYTLDGLIECSAITGDDRYRNAALPAAAHLATRMLEPQGGWCGRYDRDWKGREHPLMTGTAQMVIVWTALDADQQMREARNNAVAWLMAIQDLSAVGPAAVHGALPGSFPLWGRYEKFAFPNWGTKYFVDALLCMPTTAGWARV